MKLPVIPLLLFVLLFTRSHAYGQAITNSQSFELRGGKTISVGDYASLRYRHTTSTSVDLSVAMFINVLQQNSLHYTCLGTDLMGEYYTGIGDNTDHLFELKTGLGVTAQVDNDPWVYKGLPFMKRLNYGLCAEITVEWCMSENISLTVFGQQKFLFNKSLGSSAFTIGLGVKLNLD